MKDSRDERQQLQILTHMKLADIKFSRMLSCYDVLRFLGVRFQLNTFHSASSMPFLTPTVSLGKRRWKKGFQVIAYVFLKYMYFTDKIWENVSERPDRKQAIILPLEFPEQIFHSGKQIEVQTRAKWTLANYAN